PLYLTSTFAFEGFERHLGYEYSRTANPTRDLLGDTLATLEGGAGAVVTSSGMAAVDLVLSLLSRDDLVVAPHDCYGGTHRLPLAPAPVRCRLQRPVGRGGARRRPRPAPEAGPGRDAEQPADAGGRHRRPGRAGACGGGAGRGRQHLPLPCPAAADRARRRLR